MALSPRERRRPKQPIDAGTSWRRFAMTEWRCFWRTRSRLLAEASRLPCLTISARTCSFTRLRIQIEQPADSHPSWRAVLETPQGVKLEQITRPDGPVEPGAHRLQLAGLIAYSINSHLRTAAFQLDDVTFSQARHSADPRTQSFNQGAKPVGSANLSLASSSSIHARAAARAL